MIVAAAHCGLDEVQLLLWLEQPHIQHIVRAQRRLRKLRRQIRDDAFKDSLLEVLTDLAHTSPNPVERRRAATTALRAITDANRPKRAGARRASEDLGPPPHRGGGDPPPAADRGRCVSNTPDIPRSPSNGAPSELRVPNSEIRDSKSEILSTSDSSPIPHPSSFEDSPSPTQSSVLSPQHFPSPDSVADAALSALSDPHPRDRSEAYAAIADLIGGPTLADEGGCRKFLHALERLTAALPAASIDSEPAALTDDRNAEKRITIRDERDTPHPFLLRLHRFEGEQTWWLDAIFPADSS